MLPSRAKPEALYQICRLLGNDPVDRSELYDQMELDRRQIAAACDYGETLGFIEYVDQNRQTPLIKLGNLGYALHYADSIEESGVQNAFKSSIEMYAPYRNGFLSIVKKKEFEESDGERWITIDNLADETSRYLGANVRNREINLILKTAEAAGLGVRKVGRRGYPTRLVIRSEFDNFVSSLANSYDLPEVTNIIEDLSEQPTESDEQTEEGSTESVQDDTEDSIVSADSTVSEDGTASLLAKLRSENVTLEITVDISNKTDKEILSVIDKIEQLGQ